MRKRQAPKLQKVKVPSLRKRIRESNKMKEWRESVFQRDDYTCWLTGKRGDILIQAHHIIPFWKLLLKYNIRTYDDAMKCKALWDINNGITLSIAAHKWLHEVLS